MLLVSEESSVLKKEEYDDLRSQLKGKDIQISQLQSEVKELEVLILEQARQVREKEDEINSKEAALLREKEDLIS